MRLVILLMAFLGAANCFGASFVGTYSCNGFDPYLNHYYSGKVVIKQQNTVYRISMKYDTGEEYDATGGQYNEELLSVVFQDTKNLQRVGLEQYRLSSDKKQISGYWVYLREDKLGKEVCELDTA